MELGNEKIDVKVYKDTDGSKTVVEIFKDIDKKQAKKRLYNRLTQLINTHEIKNVTIKCGDVVCSYAFKYKVKYIHPDYDCDVARKVVRQFFKIAWKEQTESDVRQAVVRAVRSKVPLPRLDKESVNERINKFADKLNGLSAYYDYDVEQKNTSVESECIEQTVVPDDYVCHTYDESPDQADACLNEHNSQDNGESEISEEHEYPAYDGAMRQGGAYLDEHISRDNEEPAVLKEENTESYVTETLFTIEVENFKKGIVLDVV